MIHNGFLLILVTAIAFLVLAVVAVGLGILFAATVKQGFKTAAGAIERFFGAGCQVSTEGHTVTVRQVVPVLELATAKGEFEHSFTWKKDKVRFLGIPIPFSGKESVCRHVYVAKAGFDLKMHSCSFEFVAEPKYGFLPSMFCKGKYLAMVTIPEPQILSIETAELAIEDRSGVWRRLSDSDRNAINSEMFAVTREHVLKAGCGLFEASKSKLESGLRAVLPPSVEKIEFKWISIDDCCEALET